MSDLRDPVAASAAAGSCGVVRLLDKAAIVATFPFFLGMRVLGLVAHDVLELAEELWER